MSIETKYKVVNDKGEYTCGDIGISTNEWLQLLQDNKATIYIEALSCFMREPHHKGSCTTVSSKYGLPAQHFNSKIINFSKWVQKKLNRFQIIGTDNYETYWSVAMVKGWAEKGRFVWQMRTELVDALRTYLIDKLIEEFKRPFPQKPFNGYKEEYKWDLIDKVSGASTIDIIKNLKGINVVDNMRVDGVFKALLESNPNELIDCVNKLFDESQSLDNRIEQFRADMRNICHDDWKNCANDERTAAALLSCKYPDKYTFYKDEVYQTICQYFGNETRKAGKKFCHFMEIIHGFTKVYGYEIKQTIEQELSEHKIKPDILAVQTLFWCMKEFMKNKMNTKMRFTWIPYYKEFAEKLLQFRNNRKPLLDMIYEHRDELLASYLHDENGIDDLCTDIDPFTIFGLFNRGIRENNRIHSTEVFKDLLDIKANVPSDFEGIPILNNHKSHFFGFRKHRQGEDIENLWKLFEKIIHAEDFEEEYNQVITQPLIKINITMGLFWIRPDDFLAFDSTSRRYMKEKYDIHLPQKGVKYSEYMSILTSIKKNMESNVIDEKTFYEISANANSGKYTVKANTWYANITTTWKKRKNLVLYGAPGTGKTYDIPEYVVRLCKPDFDADSADRNELMKHYNQLKQEKRVVFTTFHQSMDYEDWMEGLRPVAEDNQVTYEIENGIFKSLCEEAERPIITDKEIGIAPDAVVWKVSLYGTGDNPLRTDCMKNNYVRIGWDDYGPNISDETDWSLHNGEGKQILNAFINTMKEGDIIMSCYSNRTIDAIGVVTGRYEWIESLPNYKRTRKVTWLVKGINEDIVEINGGKTMTLPTVYRLSPITLDKVKTLLEKYKKPQTMDVNTKPYVVIIDELNRGNVSKIFGELITLLEADKRKGTKNAESVILPYSKSIFQIPENVYIIATMNTADRSLGSLDYAIRRRFAFVANRPYQPDGVNFEFDLFKEVSCLFVKNFDEYAIEWDQDLKLEPADTLSDEYKPEDVWIGHSYFIVKDEYDIKDRLLYDIIPLLEEYVRDGVLTAEAQETIDHLYQIATE